MQSIPRNVTDSQVPEAVGPHLTVVPKPRPYFVRVRNVKAGSLRNKAVLVALGSYANPETGACWPSISSLVAAAECSRRSVFRAIKELERDGFIQRSTGGGRGKAATTHYHILLPPQRQGVTQGGVRVAPLPVTGWHPPSDRVAPEGVSGWHPKSKCEESPEESRERRAPAPEAPPPPRGTTTTTPAALSLPSNIECPKCKRSFPANSKAGDVCFDCNATITEIRRRIDEAGKYKDVSIRSIDEDKKVQEQRIDYKEKCAERERIHDIQRAEYQRREEERRKQQQDPEWQAEQVLKAAEQRRKAQEAHHLRLETLKAKHSGRTV